MDSEKHVLAFIQAIDSGSRGASSNLHALVSSLTASSIGSQGTFTPRQRLLSARLTCTCSAGFADALAKSVVVLESFHLAVHRAMLRDDEHAASLSTLLQHWYLQGGVHTKACVAQTIPCLAHACLEQLQSGRVADPVAKVLLAICNKEIQHRPEQPPFTTVSQNNAWEKSRAIVGCFVDAYYCYCICQPGGQVKRLKPLDPIEEITRFNVSAVLGLSLRVFLKTVLEIGEPARRRFVSLVCSIVGSNPATLPELHEQPDPAKATDLRDARPDALETIAESTEPIESKSPSDSPGNTAPRFKGLLASLGFLQAENPRPNAQPQPQAGTTDRRVAAASAAAPTTTAAPAATAPAPALSATTTETALDLDSDGRPASHRSQYRGFHPLDWLLWQHWLSASLLQLLQKGLTVCLGQLAGRPEYDLCLRLISVLQHAGISKAEFGMLVSTNSQLALFSRYPFPV